MSKVYADGSSELRTYDAFNRLATITDARGVVKTHTYDVARELLLSESYSNETNNRTYVYKFLAMPVQISDDAGVRNFAYNSFNEIDTKEQCKLSCFVHPYLRLITWDPTQPVATRPLAIQKDGTWYAYGWDLTKNIYEIFAPSGYIRSTYAYTPFVAVTASGDVTQPIQWSSEYYDNKLALVYYNYRHYNPTDGRWTNRDPIAEQGGRNLYMFVGNSYNTIDFQGLEYEEFRLVWSPTNSKISKFKCLLLLGIGNASKNIIIPQKLYNLFRTIYPIGPISALNFLGRTKYLPPGEINLLTGKYIPYSGKTFIPWQYPADILIDAYVIWVNWYCDDEEN